jgi:paraquat-inducible protein B
VAKKPSPTAVGAFILGGALLTVAAIAIWGSGRLFERRYRYVCYFPGSVNGLAIGAHVKYRGVPVGEVTGMRIHFEQRSDDTRIPVFIELSSKRVRDLGVAKEPGPQLIHELIKSGLRARLDSESFVTGQLYVNLDMFPDTPLTLVHQQGGYAEIPTIPTPMEEATKSLTGLLKQLKEADVAGTARSLASAIEGLNRLLNTPSIGRTLNELPSTVASIRKTVGNAGETLTANGPLSLELRRALVEVQRAAESVRTLADFLKRNPNALIVGKKRP